jgi:predicted nucleic acid-binding protein
MVNVIVSDTGPLITLEKMSDGYDFIRKLYERIIIPSAVLKEVAEGEFSDPLDYLEAYKIEDLIEIKSVQTISNIPEIERLDEGEKEAISLAYQLKLPLLIEETIGRKIAQSANIHISGIAGQIIKAYAGKIIKKKEAKRKLEELFKSGRINRKIYNTLVDNL